MGFDFFGADVSLSIYLQPGVQLSPGRYSVDTNGKRVQNPQDPDIVNVGLRTFFLRTDPESQEVILANGPTGDRAEAPLDFLRSMMTKFEMEIGLSLVPKINIDIDPPTNDMALAMLNSNLFTFGNVLAVKFGYTRSPFEAFPGHGTDAELFMLLKPEVRFGDTISFTLRGLGGLGMAQRTNQPIPYPKTSAEDVVSQIANRNGMRLITPDFLVPNPEVPPPEIAVEIGPTLRQSPEVQAWTVKKDWSQWETDWEFLQSVLSTIPGKMSFRIEGDQLLVDSFSNQMQASPRAVFRWYHGPKLNANTGQLQDSDQLPILKFNSDTTFAFFPSAAAGIVLNTGIGRDTVRSTGSDSAQVSGQSVFTAGTSQIAHMAATSPASPEMGKAPQIMIGKKQRANPFGVLKGVKGAYNVAQSQIAAPDTVQSVRNLAQEAEFFGNFNITIETLGAPTLRPGHLILVKGFETVGTVTEKLNGLFLIKKMVHTIGGDGFTTTITAMRNATPGEGVKVSGAVNTKDRAISSGGLDRHAIPLDAN